MARLVFVAAIWASFICWWFIVLRGEAVAEATKAAIWLGRVVAVYLGALSYWVIYNKTLAVLGATPKPIAGEARTFAEDYFGRPVAVAQGADFRHQHLVLEYKENQKIYRAPTLEESGVAEGTAASASLKALGAAVGVSVSAGSLRSTPKRAKRQKHERTL